MTTETTYTIDFNGVPNRFMATTSVYAAVRAGYLTEAEAWAQWRAVEYARLQASRTPAAKAAKLMRAKTVRLLQAERAREDLIVAQRAEAARIEVERAKAFAWNAMVASEEAADRARREQAASADRVRREVERVAREETPWTAEQRRAARLKRDQDTSDEVARIVSGDFLAGPFGGAE